MRRIGILLAGIGLCLSPVAACGGDTVDAAYCDAVRGFASHLEDAPAKGVKQRALEGFRRIAGAAPAEVGDGWQRLADNYKRTFSGTSGDVRERVAELKEELAELANDVKDRCNVEFQIPGA